MDNKILDFYKQTSLYKKDDKMNNIFKEFIVSCRKDD